LVKQIGEELFVEALNTGLATVGRKKQRSNSDPRLTADQMLIIRHMNHLIALGVYTKEAALQLLVDEKGFDPELASKNLGEKEEEKNV
jgi:hypothetical protein